jgi:hypothetical protein
LVFDSEEREGFGLFIMGVLRETVEPEEGTNETEMERITCLRCPNFGTPLTVEVVIFKEM